MNQKTALGLAAGVIALAALFVLGTRRENPPAPRAAAVPANESKRATVPPPAVPAAAAPARTSLDLLSDKVRLMEERAKELQMRRDQLAAEKAERDLKLRVADARASAKAYSGRWMSDFQLTDAQRGPVYSLFERWLGEDAARGEYRTLDRQTFERREEELRALLTPEQQQLRHNAVRDQIQEVWNSLATSVAALRDGRDPGFLMMGPPWTPASRARADELQKMSEEIRRQSGVTIEEHPRPVDPSLLGVCPVIPDSVLLADAYDLGILGLWRKAEPQVRSLLTADQLEKYAKLVPSQENPVYHHGY